MPPGNPGCLAICAIRPSHATPAAAGSTAASTAGAATGATVAAAGELSDMVAGFGVPQGERRTLNGRRLSSSARVPRVAGWRFVQADGGLRERGEGWKSRQQCNRPQQPGGGVLRQQQRRTAEAPCRLRPAHPRTALPTFTLQQSLLQFCTAPHGGGKQPSRSGTPWTGQQAAPASRTCTCTLHMPRPCTAHCVHLPLGAAGSCLCTL
jgi:hypothetical protein